MNTIDPKSLPGRLVLPDEAHAPTTSPDAQPRLVLPEGTTGQLVLPDENPRPRTWVMEGAGDAFMRAATSDIPSMLMALPRLGFRLEAGIVGAAIGMVDKVKGQQAEQKVLDFAQMTPVSKLSNALEEPLANARAYWSSGRLGEIEAWEAKKGLAEKFGLNWLARGVSSNLPQIGLSMVSGLGMAAKAETAVGWMAKAAPWAERLMFPVAMEAGEATLGMEEKERETGQKIGNLRFGIAGVAKGIAAGSLEMLSGQTMLGKIGPFREPMKKLGKVGEGVVDFFTEGITEGAQTFIGNFTEKMAVSPPKDAAEFAHMLGSRHFWEEMAEDVPESTVLGAAAGGFVSQVVNAGERLTSKPDEDRPWVRRRKETLMGLPIEPGFAAPVEPESVKSYLREQFKNLPQDQFDATWSFLENGAITLSNATNINLKQWFGQMMTETPGGAPSAQTLFQEAQRGRLLAVHSFSPEGARAIRALDGRVPAISFALVDPATVSEKTGPLLYGNMSYIAPPSLVDPSSGSVDVYGTPVATGYLSELTILGEDETGAPVLLPIEGTSEAPLTPEQTVALWQQRQENDINAMGFNPRDMAIDADSLPSIREQLDARIARRGEHAAFDRVQAELSANIAEKLAETIDPALLGANGAMNLSSMLTYRAAMAATDGTAKQTVRVRSVIKEAVDNYFFEKKDGAKRALVTQQLTETISDDVENLIAAIRDQPMPFAEAKRNDLTDFRTPGGVLLYDATDAEATQEAQTMERDLGIRIEPYTSKAEREARIMSERLNLFQKSGSVIKGSTDVFPDGRFLIKAFEAADVATMIHEATHGFKQMLYVAERHATGETKARLGAGLKALEDWAGVQNGVWDVAAEEKFATGMEQYLRSGQAPTPALKKLFAQFKEWLGKIYDDLTAKQLATFNPEVKAFIGEFVLGVPVSPKLPGSIDKKARRIEDRKALELGSLIRTLGPQKDLLTAQLTELQNLVTVNTEANTAEAEAGTFKTVAEEKGKQRAAVRSQLEVTRKGIEGSLLSLISLYEEKETILKAIPFLAGVADSAVMDPDSLEEWLNRAWAKAAAHPEAAVFAEPFRKASLDLMRQAKQGAALDLLASDLDVEQTTAQYEASVREGRLVGLRDRCFRLVQTVREIMGSTHPDLRQELRHIEHYIRVFEKSPAALQQYLDVAQKQLEESSRRIVEAEVRYKIVTRTIAARGLTADTWSPALHDLSVLEDASLRQVQDQVQADIYAAELELLSTDPTAIATSGVITDVASIMDGLVRNTYESTALEHEIPPPLLMETELEVRRLLNNRMDASEDQARSRMEGPISAIKRLWRDFSEGLLSFSFKQVWFEIGINPMKAFSYDRYNPDRPMNKLRKLVKQPIPQTIFTANEMEQVKLAFETASDLPQYYVNMIRPAWRSAMAEALPNLIDRQLVSIVRDFGDVNLAELERSYRKKLEKARAELASAEVGGTPEDILVAEENVKAWEKRLDGVTGHKALHRKPMSPRVAYLLKSLEGTFDALFTAAAANHIVGATAILDDFLPRVYGRGPQLIKAQKFFKEQMPLNKKNPHSFARVFETLVEAHAWGLTPATLDIVEIVDSYATSILTSITKRTLVMQLMSVAPNAFRVVRTGIDGKPEGFVSLANVVSHALLPKVAGLEKGGEVYVEQHIGTLIHNLYGVSAFDQNVVLTAAKRINTWLKRIQLAIDMYHFFQVSRMAFATGLIGDMTEMAKGRNSKIGMPVPFVPLRDTAEAMGWLDPSHPQHKLVRELMEVGGLQLSSGDWARRQLHEYLEATALKKLPVGTQIYHFLGHHFETFSRFLWESYVPGLKILVAAKELDRMTRSEKYKDLTREQLVKVSSKFTNDVFGGSAWSLKGRSNTTNDVASLMFLAPNWLETRFRNVLGIFKTGPEGDLWREFWFGRVGTVARNKYDQWVKGQPPGADEAPPNWATGYLWQGMIFTAAANALLASLWPDEDRDKPEGVENFTKIVIPMKDRRGYPLKVSLFSTADYVSSFLHSIPKITMLYDWWAGRQGPLLRVAKQVVAGTDFAGRPMRHAAFSPETIAIILDGALPWLHNIAFGSITGPAFEGDWKYTVVRNGTRMMGGHTTSSYPAELMLELDYYKQAAMMWNNNTMRIVNRWIGIPGVRELARSRARYHNWLVGRLWERLRKDDDLRGGVKRAMSQNVDMYMGMPDARY